MISFERRKSAMSTTTDGVDKENGSLAIDTIEQQTRKKYIKNNTKSKTVVFEKYLPVASLFTVKNKKPVILLQNKARSKVLKIFLDSGEII